MQSNSELSAKASGFYKSIETMPPKERLAQPTSGFAEDYNRLLSLVKEANPNLDAVLPPAIEIIDDTYYGMKAQTNYSEIHTYCGQIISLLSVKSPPPKFT